MNLPSSNLSSDEMARYQRQMLLPEIGFEGQQKLHAARVLVVGAGGLGSPLLTYLAAAGVGHLGLVEFDVIEKSNLHRQPLHDSSRVGQSKAQSAQHRLREINPHVEVQIFEERLSPANAEEIISQYSFVADGTDNFPTRYLISDVCAGLRIPNIHASVYRFEGQLSVLCAPGAPCYRCLFPQPPPPEAVPNCAEGGVLGVLPGILGCFQANEVIKLITGCGAPLIGKLLCVDALTCDFRKFSVSVSPSCPCNDGKAALRQAESPQETCATIPPAGKGASQLSSENISPHELAELLARAPHELQLVDVRTQAEHATGSLPQAQLLPLDSLPEKLSQLDPAKFTTVFCASGARSRLACEILRNAGFQNLRNLTGGILAWNKQGRG